jgi:hypothetical protein
MLVVLLTGVMAAAAFHGGERIPIRAYAVDFLVAGAAAVASVIERMLAGPRNGSQDTAVRRAPAKADEPQERALRRVSAWLWG